MREAFRMTLATGDGASRDRQVAALRHAVGGRRVGTRAGRCEPREVKRRPKMYPLMTRPRATRRAELLAATGNEPVGANPGE